MEGGGKKYLVHYVLEGVWAVDGEADEEEVGLGVGERTQTVVFFLPCGIPESELNCLAGLLVDGVCDVIFKDGGNVFLLQVSQHMPLCLVLERAYLWEISLAVRDKQASLPTPSIADDDNLFRVRWTLCDVRARRLSSCRHCVPAHHRADGSFT